MIEVPGGNPPSNESPLSSLAHWRVFLVGQIKKDNIKRAQELALHLRRHVGLEVISGYLDRHSPRAAAVIDRHPLALSELLQGALNSLVLLVQRIENIDKKINPVTLQRIENPGFNNEKEYGQRIEARLVFGTVPEEVKEIISSIRAIIFVAVQNGFNSDIKKLEEELKKIFNAELIALYKKLGLELPDSLKFLALNSQDVAPQPTVEDVAETASDMSLENDRKDGVHPKFAQRRARLNANQARFLQKELDEKYRSEKPGTIEQLQSLMKDFRDPGALLDTLIEPGKRP